MSNKNTIEVSMSPSLSLTVEVDFSCSGSTSLAEVIHDCIVSQYPDRIDLHKGYYTLNLLAVVKPQ